MDWLRGKVARVRQSGTFDIELADGKTIEHAPRNSLSDVAPGATPGEHVHGLTEGHSGAGEPAPPAAAQKTACAATPNAPNTASVAPPSTSAGLSSTFSRRRLGTNGHATVPEGRTPAHRGRYSGSGPNARPHSQPQLRQSLLYAVASMGTVRRPPMRLSVHAPVGLPEIISAPSRNSDI